MNDDIDGKLKAGFIMVDLRRRVTITAVSVIQFVDMCLLSTPGGTQLALARVVDVVRAADRCVM